MATLELNGKSLATQTSSAEPVIASTVTGAPALALTNATGTMPNGTQDNITRLGTVTAGTLGSAVTFPSGHIISVATVFLGSDGYRNASTSPLNFFNAVYSPQTATGIVHAHLAMHFTSVSITGTNDNRKSITYTITGDDITNVTFPTQLNMGQWGDWHARTGHHLPVLYCPPVTMDGTGTADITYSFSCANESSVSGSNFTILGDGAKETMITFYEVSP